MRALVIFRGPGKGRTFGLSCFITTFVWHQAFARTGHRHRFLCFSIPVLERNRQICYASRASGVNLVFKVEGIFIVANIDAVDGYCGRTEHQQSMVTAGEVGVQIGREVLADFRSTALETPEANKWWSRWRLAQREGKHTGTMASNGIGRF